MPGTNTPSPFWCGDDEVWGVYEHHTSLVNPDLLADQMKRFANGKLTHEENIRPVGPWEVAVRPEYKGHRSVWPRWSSREPRRENRQKNWGIWPHPTEKMMLSGCFGLVEAVRQTRPEL